MRGKHVFSNANGRPLSLWQLHERLEMVCRRRVETNKPRKRDTVSSGPERDSNDFKKLALGHIPPIALKLIAVA